MLRALHLLLQTVLLVVFYQGCKLAVALTGLPIPANILGIIVLFTLLCTGVVKERHIGQAANFFLKHLALFFVPIVVGLMVWGNLLYEYGLLMLLAIAVSSLLPLLAVAWLATRLSREKK